MEEILLLVTEYSDILHNTVQCVLVGFGRFWWVDIAFFVLPDNCNTKTSFRIEVNRASTTECSIYVTRLTKLTNWKIEIFV